MNKERWLAGAAGFLLLLYCYPLWLGGLAAIVGQLKGDAALGQMFLGAVAGHAIDPIQILQRLLLPIAAGGTVALLWAHANGLFVKILIGVTLASFGVAVFLWVFLGVSDNALDLWQPAHDGAFHTAAEFSASFAAYITSICEGLATYLLVLFGLTQAQRSSQ